MQYVLTIVELKQKSEIRTSENTKHFEKKQPTGQRKKISREAESNFN